MTDNGGPAFPIYPSETLYAPSGMSLRDYFAGQALAAILTHESAYEHSGESQVARMAYMQADAMLAIRDCTRTRSRQMTDVNIGDIWQRKNGNTYRVVDERHRDSLRDVLLKPIAGSLGRMTWKWDRLVVFDMTKLGSEGAAK